MIDVFNLKSEILPKERIVTQFSEWWSEEEIRLEIIPNIVEKGLKDSIDGALQNFKNSTNPNRKSFAEILYDLVGLNFLVNPDKVIRGKFLNFILKKKVENDSSFEKRFLGYLIKKIESSSAGICRICAKKWTISDSIYLQGLGLKQSIVCSNYQCVLEQQKDRIPKISDLKFSEFTLGISLNATYKYLCKQLVDEFDFPNDVIFQPSKQIILLPEEITPLGIFSTLYDFQSSIGLKIIDMLEKYEKKTSRALVVLPTGSGKTRLVVETLIEWINNGKKGKETSKFILWIVDRNELCQQTFATFAEIFRFRSKKDSSLKLHPIYGDNPKNIRDILYQYSEDKGGEIHEENGIIIASIQSLHKLSESHDQGSLPELGKYTSIVIIDEAHHAVSSNKSYTKVLHALGFDFKNVQKQGVDIHKYHTCLLGLTATPFRGTDELGKSTKDLLNRFGTKERILWPPFSDNTVDENIPPFAHLDAQKTAYQFERVKLYGERSYDKDGKIRNYRYIIQKLFSGTTYSSNPIIHDKTYVTKNIDFEFKEPGRYQIQLIVTDNEGTDSKNLAGINIEIYPLEQLEEKSNLDEMKRLYKHLIKREILSKPHHYIIDNSNAKYGTQKDIERFKVFHDLDKSTIVNIGKDNFRNNKIIKKIISLVDPKKENRKSILLFACSVEHSKLLSFILDAIYGITSASVDHKTSPDERDQTINDFRTGKIKVLCNFGILTTGFDAPKVECVFVTRPTFSHLLYNQMTGRGLRGPRSNGTSDCIIVDISDNIQLYDNEGLVEQAWNIFDYIYETSYDERDNTKKEQKCFGCFGKGKQQFETESQDCQICKGTGIIQRKKEDNISSNRIVKINKEELSKLQKEIFVKHPNWSLKEINEYAKKSLKYDILLESKDTKTKPSGDWGALCKKCNNISSDMPRTLSQFGRSTELISNDNPKGIFDVCKECRNKDDKLNP
ncbi:MAG: DEAD/DEAH box helicase family protein [Thaumarchaeota archaeon]|nr:DEAD/DEAH box helicase family protein [Nitrososphaerota archaeon]